VIALLLSSGIGILTAAGVWLVLRPRTFDVIVGLTLLSYSVNLLIFAAGRPGAGAAPILRPDLEPGLVNYADPLPQALVLTAIVISFAMTAILTALAVRSFGTGGSDHVEGREP
jgi:multicomponent K+:H+ antiporter subunit C